MDIRDIVLAIVLAVARADKHPDPKSYADAVERAANGQEPWPEVAETAPESEVQPL